jgi:multiple sugar transport system substrate-binding protein
MGLGCRGPSAEEQAAVRPVTLNYWTVFGNVVELKRQAEEYKKIRPYVTVNIRQLRYEEFDKIFVNALADDVGPDLVSMHVRWLGQHRTRLAVMPQTVKVARVTVKEGINPEQVVTIETNRMPTIDIIRSNYVSTVPEDIAVGSDLYGLPLAVDSLALFYNKNLLDAAGVPLPPATWAEFLDAVKKTTKFDRSGKIVQAGAAIGTGNNIDNAFDLISLLMTQNGVKMADGSRVTFAEGLDRTVSASQPALDALRFYTDFARPTKEVYTWNDSFGQAIDEFAAGKAVFYLGFAYDLARIKAKAPQLNIGISPVPQQLAEAAPVNVANYWVESVSRHGSHQNEAWDFLRFLSAPNAIKTYADASQLPSPLRVHVEAGREHPLLGPFYLGVLSAKNWYHGRDSDAANQAMKDLITAYLAPYTDEEARNPLRRDAELVLRAQTIIQQTF